ncbi:MAG: hypothetical protein ABIH01_00275 [Candidatus Omnitrophota bacterium]
MKTIRRIMSLVTILILLCIFQPATAVLAGENFRQHTTAVIEQGHWASTDTGPIRSAMEEPLTEEQKPQLQLMILPDGLSAVDAYHLEVAVNAVMGFSEDLVEEIFLDGTGFSKLAIEKGSVQEIFKLLYPDQEPPADLDATTVVIQKNDEEPDMRIIINPEVFSDFPRLIVIVAHELGGHCPQYAKYKAHLTKGALPISKAEEEVVAYKRGIRILETIMQAPELKHLNAVKTIKVKYLPEEKELLEFWKTCLPTETSLPPKK